jgi:Holliday junction resolvase
MRAGRTDANHEAVVKALREAGATVQSLASVGKGVPDLLVGFKSQTMLMEVKDSAKPASKRRLTEDQLRWHGSWRGGPLAIVDSPESAISMLRLL